MTNFSGFNKREIIALLKSLFAHVAWGMSFIATKVAVNDVKPITVVWLRFAIGAVILGVFVYFRKQFEFPKLRELLYFTLLGFIGITFHQWLQSTGLVTAEASTTAWIVSTTPVFIAFLGWLFLREKLGWKGSVGIGLAAVGVIMVVTKGKLGSLLFAGKFGNPGDVLIMIGAPNWAIFSVLSRRGLKRHPAARMMFYVMSIGWLFSSILLLSGPGLGNVRTLSMNGWLGVIFLGVVCSGLGYIAWYDALEVLPASRVGVFLYLEPLVAVVVSAIILGERIMMASIMGGVIILFGVWLVNRPSGRK